MTSKAKKDSKVTILEKRIDDLFSYLEKLHHKFGKLEGFVTNVKLDTDTALFRTDRIRSDLNGIYDDIEELNKKR